MGTTLYFRNAGWGSGNEYGKWSPGTSTNNLAGSSTGWAFPWRWYTSRGSSATTRTRTTTVGPTSGQEIATTDHYVSAPVDSDTTISGDITINLRMAESVATVNAGAQVILERVDNTGTIQETILNTEAGVELGTTEAAQNWTDTPTSTLLHRGDRIRCRIAVNDAGGTLAAGTVTLWRDGPTGGASGDSYITFTETLPLITENPTAGTTVYLTDTAAEVDPNGGSYDAKEAWTSRGSGVVSAVRATATGETAPLQWTTTSGGNFIEWYTKSLIAFTLGGQVSVSYRGAESNAAANVAPRFEIAVCDSDGTNPVVWAANTSSTEFGTTEVADVLCVAGDDVTVAYGQRLRFRMFIDDANATPMATGHTATITYGATGTGTGDTFLTFAQTIADVGSGTTVTLGQASGTNTAQAITKLETYTLGQPEVVNEALPLVLASTVSGLVAVAISSTEIHVSWDDFPGATGYDIERGGVVIAEFLPASPPEYQNTGLTPSTLYSYRVRAVT